MSIEGLKNPLLVAALRGSWPLNRHDLAYQRQSAAADA